MVKTLLLLSLFYTLSASAFAKDTEGKFAVKGAGASRCQDFVAALDQKNEPKVLSYGAWLNGYLSFYNQETVETFDISPWQSSEYLMRALYQHCKKNPSVNYFIAVGYMIDALKSERLTSSSDLVSISDGTHKHYYYRELIKRLKKALNEKLDIDLEIDGQFDNATEQAVRELQKRNSLPVTGVPDQETLHFAFTKN